MIQELSRDVSQWLLNGILRQDILLSRFLLTSVEQGGKYNVCPVKAVSHEKQEELESVPFPILKRIGMSQKSGHPGNPTWTDSSSRTPLCVQVRQDWPSTHK